MDDSPIVSAHGADGDRTAKPFGFFPQALGQFHQGIFPPETVILGVHHDPFFVFRLFVDDLVDQVLDGIRVRAERGGARHAACSRGLSTNHLCGLGWWIWIIPLPGGDTSVGIVWDERFFSLPGSGGLAERLDAFLAAHPVGRQVMHGAERVAGDFQALTQVDLQVPEREVTALIGPSGCGKSTLLRIIVGQETADAGHVTLAPGLRPAR